jgi:hypothetical protein
MSAEDGLPTRPGALRWRPEARAALPPPKTAEPAAPRLPAVLAQECEAMAGYATTWGKHIPAELGGRVSRALLESPGGAQGLAELIDVHGLLTELVAPAHPNTILLMASEARVHPFLHALGPVRLVRQLLLFATLCLAMVCGLSGLKIIHSDILAKNWLQLEGWAALAVNLFLLSTASLGAAFANLSIVNRYIAHGNYDQKYESTYWIRVMLGMMSALILGQILFDTIYKPSPDRGEESLEMVALGRITIAFLGGYSAAQVQALLDNLSAAMGALSRGNQAPPPPRPSSANQTRP